MTIATETSPSSRTVPRVTGLHHVGLTVRDIGASEAWYSEVLGLVRVFVEPHATGDGYAVVMTRPATGLFVGLDHHPDADRQMFSPRRTELSHLALQVTSSKAIDESDHPPQRRWRRTRSTVPSTEPVPHALVLFHDPDGIPIELFWFGG